ncbi:MAG: hypothetical protein WAN54_17060, partial [Syntrophobacteraceae bacterium]
MPNDLTELNKFADKWLSGLSWEKKSVRATFKLSQEATEMLTALTESKGESMKEFFDTLCFRLLFWEEALESNDPMLAKLNEHDKKAEIEKLQRQVRKTYVISKTAREKLARFAEKYKLSRDAFVEHAVRFENESITKRAEEKRRTHTRAFEIVQSSSTALENALEELKGILEEGDPIRGRFLSVCIVLDNLCQAIEQELQ